MEAAPAKEQTPPDKKRKRLLAAGIATLVIIIVGGGLWWFFTRSDGGGKAEKSTNVTTSSAQKTSKSSEESDTKDKKTTSGKTYPVKVYFSKDPESYDDPTKVFPVTRNSPDLGTAKYSLGELISGPTTSEKATGFFGEIKLSGSSKCDGADFVLATDSSTATVRFCKTFESAGVMADARMQSQIETTLLQFSSISKVILLNREGYCLFDASGEEGCGV